MVYSVMIHTHVQYRDTGVFAMMIELFKDWEDQVDYPKGAVIFRETEQGDFMYVVTKGEVEVSLKGEPLGAELPGGIIGEMAMINAKFRSATATAIRRIGLEFTRARF